MHAVPARPMLDTTSTQESIAAWPSCAPALDARVEELLELLPISRRHDAVIVEALMREFPGLPHPNCYWNRAAATIARYCRRQQQRAAGVEVDRARLRAKGLPEWLAGRPPRAAPAMSPSSPPAATGEYD
jgi:hypothetical protein